MNRHRSGWKTPWYGVPVPVIIANFYDDTRFTGHFGVGWNCFEAHREGDFFSKSARKEEIKEFMKRLDLPMDVFQRAPQR